jgi:hypothetical protein
MRSFRHWTFQYIRDRIAVIYYRKVYPDRPWLTPAANAFLMSFLRETDIGLEFGSGHSTLWFAKRIRHLSSVEHNEAWYKKVYQMLKDNHQENVDYRFVPKGEDAEGTQAAYVRQVDRFGANSLDFVLVDGIYRDFCTLNVLNLIRPGGILVIDNVNKYLPSNSHSPNSRTPEDGPSGEIWEEVYHELRHWRTIWTSSGVWDTAIFIRPCNSP